MDILSIAPGALPGALPEGPADADRADDFAALVSDSSKDAPAPERPRPKAAAPKDQPEAAAPAAPVQEPPAAPAPSTDHADAPKTEAGAGKTDAPTDKAPAAPATGVGTSATPAAPSILGAILTGAAATPFATGPATPAAPAAGQAATPATPAVVSAAPKAADSKPDAAPATPAAPAAATAAAAGPRAGAQPAATPITTAATPAEAAPTPTTAAPLSTPAAPAAPAAAAPASTPTAEVLAAASPEAKPDAPRADRAAPAKSAKAGEGKSTAPQSATAPDAGAAKPAAAVMDAASAAKPVPTVMAERLAAAADDAAPLPAAGGDPAQGAGADQALDTADAGVRRTEAAHAAQAPERSGHAARVHALDIAALATRFAARVAGGATKFSIRLDPPELGRVDVRLEVSSDGVAHARLVAERPEALAELTRHARALERELADAGVDLSRGGLSFELAQHDGDGPREREPGFADASQHAALGFERAEALGDAAEAQAEVDTAYGYSVLRRGRLDVRI